MEISCDIIRDLLPLYAEDLVSDDSRRLVDDHLCGCDPCTKQLGILKKAAQLPIEVNPGALMRVEKTLRRRKLLTVVTAVLSVITVLICAVGWLNVTVYLEPEEAVIGVEAQEDGSLHYEVYDYVMGHSSFGWHQAEYEYLCFAHTWNTTRLDYLSSLWKSWNGLPQEANHYEDRNYEHLVKGGGDPSVGSGRVKEVIRKADCHHWYLDAYDGTLVQKLWGEEGTAEPDPLLSSSSHLQKNFWGAACLAAAFAACSYIPGKPWIQELMKRFAILCGCVVFSQLFLTGGRFVSIYVSDEPFRTLRWIYTISVFLTLTVLFWRQLHLLNKQDKGL